MLRVKPAPLLGGHGHTLRLLRLLQNNYGGATPTANQTVGVAPQPARACWCY